MAETRAELRRDTSSVTVMWPSELAGDCGACPLSVQVIDQRLHFGTSMPLQVGAFIPLFTSNTFSPEVHERAVHLVRAHRSDYSSLWSLIEFIAPKVGCAP